MPEFLGPGQALPDFMPFLKFRLDDVVILESGMSPNTIITAPNTLSFRMDLGFDGTLSPLIIGQPFEVVHHVERIEDGARTTLHGGAFTVTLSNLHHLTFTSGPWTTGLNGSGANFQLPPTPADSGTFRILTHVHAVNAWVRPMISAFHDGVVIQVTAATPVPE